MTCALYHKDFTFYPFQEHDKATVNKKRGVKILGKKQNADTTKNSSILYFPRNV